MLEKKITTHFTLFPGTHRPLRHNTQRTPSVAPLSLGETSRPKKEKKGSINLFLHPVRFFLLRPHRLRPRCLRHRHFPAPRPLRRVAKGLQGGSSRDRE